MAPQNDNDTIIPTVNGPRGLLAVGDLASAIANACERWEEENEDDSIYQLCLEHSWSFSEFIAACLTEVGWVCAPTDHNSGIADEGCEHGFTFAANCTTCTPVLMCSTGNHQFLDLGHGVCSCGNGTAGKLWEHPNETVQL